MSWPTQGLQTNRSWGPDPAHRPALAESNPGGGSSWNTPALQPPGVPLAFAPVLVSPWLAEAGAGSPARPVSEPRPFSRRKVCHPPGQEIQSRHQDGEVCWHDRGRNRYVRRSPSPCPWWAGAKGRGRGGGHGTDSEGLGAAQGQGPGPVVLAPLPGRLPGTGPVCMQQAFTPCVGAAVLQASPQCCR